MANKYVNTSLTTIEVKTSDRTSELKPNESLELGDEEIVWSVRPLVESAPLPWEK